MASYKIPTRQLGSTGEQISIIGMGGALDSARFKYRLAEAMDCPSSDVDGMVIGGHSDVGICLLYTSDAADE